MFKTQVEPLTCGSCFYSSFEHFMASFLWSISVQTMKKSGRFVKFVWPGFLLQSQRSFPITAACTTSGTLTLCSNKSFKVTGSGTTFLWLAALCFHFLGKSTKLSNHSIKYCVISLFTNIVVLLFQMTPLT